MNDRDLEARPCADQPLFAHNHRQRRCSDAKRKPSATIGIVIREVVQAEEGEDTGGAGMLASNARKG